jgi:hypothetical protein
LQEDESENVSITDQPAGTPAYSGPGVEPTSHTITTTALISHPDLQHMVTVLDAPSQQGADNFVDTKEFSSFVLQQSYPSGVHFDVTEEMKEEEEREREMGGGGRRRSSDARAMQWDLARTEQMVDRDAGEDVSDNAALASMLSGRRMSESGAKVETKSPWDREVFAPASSSSERHVSFPDESPVAKLRRLSQDRRDSLGFTSTGNVTSPDQDAVISPATVNVVHSPTDKPVFLLGSSPPMSPSDSFSIENETVRGEGQGHGAEVWVQTPLETLGRRGGDDAQRKGDDGSPDRESIV